MKKPFPAFAGLFAKKQVDKVTFYRYLHFPRQAGSMATSTFGEYISYNIQQCLSWHFQTILKIVDTKGPVEFKVKYQLKMKLRQNFVHSVCVSGYCETSKVERASPHCRDLQAALKAPKGVSHTNRTLSNFI